MQVLVIEDEKKLAGAIRGALVTDGHDVSVANTGEDGFYLLHTRGFDLVLLDLMLPMRSGIEVLKDMRKCGLGIPVLILTSRDSLEDRVRGLDAGADDYLVKPFALPEMLARIRALLRRSSKPSSTIHLKLQLSDLEMDLASRTVRRASQVVELTPKEFDLLRYLLMNEDAVVSREMIARDVWKETSRYTTLDNVIDVHVTRLRRKIDDPFPKKLLHTVRGIGFILRKEMQ
jgi:two-component system, OmpR family, copper resistance phosphate regulon response regulator CusR